MGDMELEDLTREKLKDYKGILLKLPPNFNRSPKYKGMAITKIIPMEGVKAMSLTSVNKHLSWFGSMMTYALKEGHIGTNPATGLQVQRNSRGYLERMAYSVEDIRAIIKALSSDHKHPERYWVPLIGIYQGMRLNEICQLYCTDVLKTDGVWCISVNREAADKELKNTASQRLIPVHPQLEKAGFIEYVNEAKQRHERLWPALDEMVTPMILVSGFRGSIDDTLQRSHAKFSTPYATPSSTSSSSLEQLRH